MPIIAKPIGQISPAEECKFWSQVDRSGDCWEWVGYRTPLGYGRTRVNGQNRAAHRISKTLSLGHEIDPLMQVDHMCRNPSCCNPAHLRIVDHRTNVTENSLSFSAVNAAKTHCAHGHPFSGDNLRFSKKSGQRRCVTCKRREDRERWKRKAQLMKEASK